MSLCGTVSHSGVSRWTDVSMGELADRNPVAIFDGEESAFLAANGLGRLQTMNQGSTALTAWVQV